MSGIDGGRPPEDALDLELDQAIDALNLEHRPQVPPGREAEVWDALEVAMALRATGSAAPAEADFPRQLAARLAAEPALRSPNGQIRLARSTGERMRRSVRALVPVSQAIGACAMAGMVAGFVIGGGGSRLAMRVAGEMFTREHPGVTVITESSDRPVGNISWSGTIALMMEGMAYGLLGGLFFYIARRWLPASTRAAGLAYGGLLLLVTGAAIVTASNDDFERIGSPVLNVIMFGSLFILFGLAVAPLSSLILRAARPAAGGMEKARRLLGWPLALMGVFGIAVITLAVLSTLAVSASELVSGIDGFDLRIAATMVTLLAVVVVLPIARLLAGAADDHFITAGRLRASTADAVGRWALRVAVLAGAGLMLAQIVMILA